MLDIRVLTQKKLLSRFAKLQLFHALIDQKTKFSNGSLHNCAAFLHHFHSKEEIWENWGIFFHKILAYVVQSTKDLSMHQVSMLHTYQMYFYPFHSNMSKVFSKKSKKSLRDFQESTYFSNFSSFFIITLMEPFLSFLILSILQIDLHSSDWIITKTFRKPFWDIFVWNKIW